MFQEGKDGQTHYLCQRAEKEGLVDCCICTQHDCGAMVGIFDEVKEK